MLDKKYTDWIEYEVGDVFPGNRFARALEALQQFYEINETQVNFERYLMDISDAFPTEKKDYIRAFNIIEVFMKALYNTLVSPSYHIGDDYIQDVDREEYAELLRNVFKKLQIPNLTGTVAETLAGQPGFKMEYLITYQNRNKVTHDSQTEMKKNEVDKVIRAALICYLDLAYTYREQINAKYGANQRKTMIDRYKYRETAKKHWAAFTADFTYVDIKWTNIQANNEVLSVDEILNYNFNIIKLLGDAGTGKTTALRRMEYLLAKQPAGGQEKPLPVFISLANLRNGKSIILSEAANVLNISRWDAQELISHKEVILLLDGYNEILNDETKRKVASELDSLAAQNDGLKIIMTDRNYTTRNVMRNDVPTLRMARMFYLFSLSLEDKKKFFEANMKDPEKLQIIMKEFSESPETFAMMNKPLTLKHLIDVVEKTGEIPFDLTGGYVDMLYEREMEEKKDPNVAYLRYYLEAFAHLNKDRFSYDDAMEQIALVNRIKAFTKPDSQSCIDLAVGMGILQRENDDQLAFSSEEYRVYFTNCCRDSGLGNRIDELLG